MLLGTLSRGLYVCEGDICRPLEVSSSFGDQLNALRILEGTFLSNGQLALATGRNGLLILDKKGQLLRRFDMSVGLPSNSIQYAYPDLQGGLWLASSNGISRLEIPAPVSVFRGEKGLEVRVYNFENHKGHLYTGTANGVLRNVNPTGTGSFEKVGGPNGVVFSLLSTGETLLVAFPYLGVYELKQGVMRKVFNLGVPLKLLQSRFDPNLVFMGRGETNNGFSMLYQTPQGWKHLSIDPIVPDEIREIGEEKPGVIWLGTRNQRIYPA